ncbi:MAG: multidrug effflux MFS transporter [Arenicellaceae bacterium]|nr:multidrug effflux MFS transporter [Arenicellaceae bacterium]
MFSREFSIFVATLMAIVALSIDALLPALGLITQELGIINANQTQLVISMLFLGLALGQLICGPLSDALGRKPVLYSGLVVYLFGTIVCFFSSNITTLLIGRVIQGLGCAGPYVSSVSLVRDKFEGRGMAKIMSLVMMIFVLVPAFAPILGQAVLFVSPWRGIFAVYLFYALLIMVWINIRLPETLPKEQRIPFTVDGFIAGFKEVVSNRVTISITLATGLSFGSFIGYLNSSQQIFQVQFETGKMFSLYFGSLALALGAASMLNSRLVERLGMYHLASRAYLAIVLTSIAFTVIQFYVNIHLWMFMTYMLILFFNLGMVFGNLNAMAMEPMGHVAGIAAAVIGSVSSMMSIIIGTTIGQLYNKTVMPLTGGFLLMSSLALILLYYSQRHKEESF